MNDPMHAHIILVPVNHCSGGFSFEVLTYASADFRRARPEYRKPRPGGMRNTMADETRIYDWSPDVNH